ncbi:hypothetical protein DFS33DRAFT_1377930 [Desarmillaria ectypa]|nr:hypothetical protein DFS33DRAFT_1377930 [Desarmillaria ectypa]
MTNSDIEALCPIYRDTVGDNGEPVSDVSDREFNANLTLISRCQSELTRAGITGVSPNDADDSSRHAPSWNGNWIWIPTLFLAACKEYQFAKAKKVKGEDGAVKYIGIFTDSLVRVLRSGHLKKETTYADLVHLLDRMPHQTPVVAGNRKGSCIWYQE